MSNPSTARRARRGCAVIAVVGLTLSACSSSHKTASTTASSPPASDVPSTTLAPTTSSAAPTTTEPFGPTSPLTGLALIDPSIATRPALVVKIDNHPLARPQSGLNEADIVFEENVEQLTRFAAVFQSQASNPVGPIRSGRTQDVALLGSFNRPLFAWSGGNRRVTDAIQGSDLRQLSAQQQSGFFRSNDRPAPHNLYSRTDALFSLAPADAGPPPAQFSYRSATTAAVGDDIAGVNVSMDGVKVSWHWDSGSGTFLRFSDGKPQVDAISKTQVSTNNVVVLSVVYLPSPADAQSPEAQTLGTGDAVVFSAGKYQPGTWTRSDRLQPFTVKDAVGTVLALTPGRTFVELARSGSAAPVPAGTDPNSVAFP